jgi:uncharacterized coiled-coil protein SlyX
MNVGRLLTQQREVTHLQTKLREKEQTIGAQRKKIDELSATVKNQEVALVAQSARIQALEEGK